MQKNKIDFIADLLADKRIEISLKEKAFELASKEVKKVLSVENENLGRIVEIEKKLKDFDNNVTLKVLDGNKNEVEIKNEVNLTQNESKSEGNFIKKAHKPKDVAEFMSLFNLPTGLKYLTHDFDEGGDFNTEGFLLKTKSVFEKYSKSLAIPQSLWQIINQFAFSDNPNWGNKQTDGWSKPEWIQWSNEHNKHLKRNPQFEKVIENFRNYTRVESPKLSSILNNVLKEKFGDEFGGLNLQIIDCEKADFYTHVDNFKESIRLILDGIKKRIDTSNEISINYLRKTNGDYFERIIKICHHNSFPTKPLDEFISEIEKAEKGELGDISRKLKGYCNWSIETVWAGEPTRVNILQEAEGIGVDFLDASIPLNGFTHILTFYYK